MKAFNYLILFLSVGILSGCSQPNIISKEYSKKQIIHHSKIKNIENISEYVVYLDKGDKLPVSLNIDGKLFNLTDKNIFLTVKQKIYFKLSIPDSIDIDNIGKLNKKEKIAILQKIKIFISPDARNWSPYNDIRSVKQLFNIQDGGSFSFGMGMTRVEGIKVFVNILDHSAHS